MQAQINASTAISDELERLIAASTKEGAIEDALKHTALRLLEHAIGLAEMPAYLRLVADAADEMLKNQRMVN